MNSKKDAEKNQQILRALLREPANKYCADCKSSKNPRWASWNLGVFICIRCSGIHRSMGTHVSRVKSVDLDSWTSEQAKSMVMWGNAKANAYWEAKLPDGYVPNESKIENFIRTKYDLKKWCGEGAPDPSKVTVKASSVAPSSVVPGRSSSNSATPSVASSANNSLLDLGIDLSTPAKPKPRPKLTSQSSSTLSILDEAQKKPQASRPDNRPELKKSILSLYSTPTPSTQSLPNFSSNTTTSATAGMASLNLNNTSNVQSAWSSNVWASNGNGAGNGAGNSSRASSKNTEEDVFKNIWK